MHRMTKFKPSRICLNVKSRIDSLKSCNRLTFSFSCTFFQNNKFHWLFRKDYRKPHRQSLLHLNSDLYLTYSLISITYHLKHPPIVWCSRTALAGIVLIIY